MREDNNNYSSYQAQTSQTNSYVRKKPVYDKELLWSNRKKYLGHKRALGYVYTADIVIGLIAAVIVKDSLSGIASNPAGVVSLVLYIGLIAASVITVTCLDNKKVIFTAMIMFAVCGVLLYLIFSSFIYLVFFLFFAGQMGIALILARNLDYLKTQFGYPYFSEAIVENQMNSKNKYS